MGRIMCVEDRDRQIVAIDDLDRAHDERVFRRKELMTALIPRGNLVKNTMPHELRQNLSQGCDRSERLGAIPARVDDLQALAASPSFQISNRAPRTNLRVGGGSFNGMQEESFAFTS